ncbi:MAG: protein phosphatase 2C domain-containing protein, partial [Pyrinomonadaceae bacterium]|nr:protein phosphatase 2C domain-containing protein [Pyrinomonadaceae bacterium]
QRQMCIRDRKGVFAVADGVGGAQAGDVASQMAMEILGVAFQNFADNIDPEDVLKAAIERANEAVYQMANELPQLASMASTVAAVHLSGNIATIAHVGDSRVYRIDPEGYLYRETDDHSMVEEEVRAGRMTPEQAANHPGRNVISRAVGAESDVNIDLKTIMIEPGTIFLLCSDGITRHVSDEEIGRLLTTGMMPELICEHLKELCYERGAEDNLTAVVVKTLVPEFAGVPAAPAVSAPAAFDREEETIATARSPFSEPAEQYQPAVEPPVEDVFIPTVEPEESESYLLETASTPAGEPFDTEGYTSSSVVVPAQHQPTPPPAPVVEREYSMFGSQNAEPAPVAASSGGIVSRILTAFIWVVLGGVLGIAGYYYWNQQNMPETAVQPVPQLQPKSNDIQASSLEESRRLVDADPAKYLEARSATPKDATDFYLMGRALLLTGDFYGARRQFTFAKEKLKDADPKEVNTLAAEIAIANSIIGNGPAEVQFKREVEQSRSLTAGAKQDANTNSAANTASAANANVNTAP